MNKEEIFAAYFINPGIEECEHSTGDLTLDNARGIVFGDATPTEANLRQEPFRVSFLKSYSVWNRNELDDFFNDSYNEEFYRIYCKAKGEPTGWRLVQLSISGNDHCVDGGAFVHAYWLKDKTSFLSKKAQKNQKKISSWFNKNTQCLMLQPQCYTLLIEQSNLAYILDYSEDSSYRCVIKLTEFVPDPKTGNCVKSREFIRWFLDEHVTAWTIYRNVSLNWTT